MAAVQTFVWLSILVTTLLTMSKLRGGFNYRWEYVFSPLMTTLTCSGLWKTFLLFIERTAKGEHDPDCPFQMFIHEQKCKLYDILIPAYESFFGVLVILDLSEFLNRVMISHERHPRADHLCYTLLVGSVISMCIRLLRTAHHKSIEMIHEEGEEYYLEWKKNTRFPVIGIFLNQIFNLLGATTMVCAGGACNSIYISSLTLFFSSIGISLTDWLPYLNGLGFVFIIVALFSLYSAKKSFTYPPFIVGCICSAIILADITALFHNLYLLILANLGLIVCSCYNLKTNMAPLQLRKKRRHRKKKQKEEEKGGEGIGGWGLRSGDGRPRERVEEDGESARDEEKMI
jgi:hypothetical protein